MPLGAQLESACATTQAVDRRYRPMNSELWQLIPDRWLLAHLHALRQEPGPSKVPRTQHLMIITASAILSLRAWLGPLWITRIGLHLKTAGMSEKPAAPENDRR